MSNYKTYSYCKRNFSGVSLSASRFTSSSVRKYLFLFFFSVLFSCNGSDGKKLFFLPDSAAGELLFLGYAGLNLLNPAAELNRESVPLIIGEPNRSDLQDIHKPHFETKSGSCLSSNSDFYYRNESGLRFQYCNQLFAQNATAIQTTIDQIYSDLSQTAFPVFRSGILEIRVERAAQIRERGKIIAAIDGNSIGPVLTKAKLDGQLINFKSHIPLSNTTVGSGVLTRTFPQAYFHLLVLENSLLLLYELPVRNRFLVVALHSGEISNRIINGLKRIKSIEKTLLKKTRRGNHFISEIYFPVQGKNHFPFIEISGAANQNTIDQIILVNENGEIFKQEIFLFASAVLIIPGSRFEFKREFEFTSVNGKDSRLYIYDEFQVNGASSLRTLSADNSESGFLKPAIHCLSATICGSIGLHPDFARKLQEYFQTKNNNSNPFLSHCSPDDYTLTEINPFGIIKNKSGTKESSGTISTGGKFIEIKMNQDCRHGKVVIFAGKTLIDPGYDNSRIGEILLFVADAGFFNSSNARQESSLRFLTPFNAIRLLDLESGEIRILREGAPPEIRFIFGDRYFSEDINIATTDIFSRVHSLLIAPRGSETFEIFHGRKSSGLRPDLINLHAMSPGYDLPVMNPDSLPVQLAEILPAGALTDDGTSVPGDEFVEFLFSEDLHGESANLFQLKIERLSDGNQFIYRFPAPRVVTNQRIVIFKQFPLCFPLESQGVIYQQLYLPNQAAVYTLLDYSGGELEQITIDKAIYGTLYQPDLRFSFARIFADDIWRPSDGRFAFESNCHYTGATPGAEESYYSFFTIVSEGFGFRRYLFHTEIDQELIAWQAGVDLLIPDVSRETIIASREIYEFTYPSTPNIIRVLIRADSIPDNPDKVIENLLIDELYLSEPPLIFESIYPVPASDDVEWVRFCSPGGLTVTDIGSGLFIRDSSTEDEIIPWSLRFPDSPSNTTLNENSLDLAPGECAILVDPDYSGQPLPISSRDRNLWTIRTSSAIGNGISASEGLLLYRREIDNSITIFASYGLPDTPVSFAIKVQSGELIKRKTGTIYDRINNFRVIQ